jgi:PAS domain S-box-containing protein
LGTQKALVFDEQQLGQRLAVARQELASLRARSLADENPASLLHQTLASYSTALDDLASLAEDMPKTGHPAESAPATDKVESNEGLEGANTPLELHWLQSIIDNTFMAIACFDLDFRFTAVNQVFIDRVGFTREQLIGAGYFDLFPASPFRAIYERVKASGIREQFLSTPYTYPNHPERGVYYYDWAVSPVMIQGQIKGLIISTHDVTVVELARQEREQRLQAQAALVELAQRLLAQINAEDILQCLTDGARVLTKARIGLSHLAVQQGGADLSASSLADGISVSPDSKWDLKMLRSAYERLSTEGGGRQGALPIIQRLSDVEVLSSDQTPDSLLSAPLTGLDGEVRGLVTVFDRDTGEFTPEDEWLLNQLTGIARLALLQLEAKQATEKHTNELLTLFAALTDAVVVCDTQGVTLNANPAARELVGPEVDTLDRETLALKRAFRHSDDQPYKSSDLPVYRALCGEVVTDQIIVLTDMQGQRRVVMTSASPLYEFGKLTGAVTVWHEITARENTRLLLETERALLATIIENAPEGIIVLDESDRVVLTNPTAVRFFGQDVVYGEDLISQLPMHYSYLNGELDRRAHLPLSLALANGRISHDMEVGVTWPSGEQRTLLMNAAPIPDPHKHSGRVVIVFQDITKRRKVENALRQRVHDLRLLTRLSRQFSATLDTKRVLDGILEAAHLLVPATGACVWLWDLHDSNLLTCASVSGGNWVTSPLGIRVHPNASWNQLIKGSRIVIINDISAAPDLVVRVDEWLGIHSGSMMGVPLRVGDRWVGSLLVLSAQIDRFRGYERMLLETLAPAAAAALDNARSMTDAANNAATSERTRLARELHDAVSQSLFSASIIAETLPRLWERDPNLVKAGLGQLQTLTRSSLAEMRLLLLELRPSALIETALAELIKQLVDTATGRSSMMVDLELDKNCRVPPDIQIGLYRITQEALNNLVKHAHATRLKVSLRQLGQAVEISVSDNGRGFDPTQVKSGHLGLAIMRERAEALGLDLQITSQLDTGTTILVHYPRANSQELNR